MESASLVMRNARAFGGIACVLAFLCRPLLKRKNHGRHRRDGYGKFLGCFLPSSSWSEHTDRIKHDSRGHIWCSEAFFSPRYGVFMCKPTCTFVCVRAVRDAARLHVGLQS